MFEMLRADLFASPELLERVPRDGFMTLSLVPVLMVLARDSRTRCVQYLNAQAKLAARLLARAQHAGQAELPAVRQLAAFARSNAALALRLKD